MASPRVYFIVLLTFLTIYSLCFAGMKGCFDVPEKEKMQWLQGVASSAKLPVWVTRLVIKESYRQGFDPALALAVTRVESWGDPKAVSVSGAIGLMQVMPLHTNKPWKLYIPGYNVRLGIKYLKLCFRKYRNITWAISAYNMGHNNRNLNHNYVQKVAQRYRLIVTRSPRLGDVFHYVTGGGRGSQWLKYKKGTFSIRIPSKKNTISKIGSNRMRKGIGETIKYLISIGV